MSICDSIKTKSKKIPFEGSDTSRFDVNSTTEDSTNLTTKMSSPTTKKVAFDTTNVQTLQYEPIKDLVSNDFEDLISNTRNFDILTDIFYHPLDSTSKLRKMLFIVNNDFDYKLLKKHRLNVEYQLHNTIVTPTVVCYNLSNPRRRLSSVPFHNNSAKLFYNINTLTVLPSSKDDVSIKIPMTEDLDLTPIQPSGVLTINKSMTEVEMASILFYLLSYYNVSISNTLYKAISYYIDVMVLYRRPFILYKDRVMYGSLEEYNKFGISLF